MLSGSAFHRLYLGEEEKYVNLPKSINWQGTIIFDEDSNKYSKNILFI